MMERSVDAPVPVTAHAAICLQPGLMVCHTAARDLDAIERRKTFDSDCEFIHFNCQLAGNFEGQVGQCALKFSQGDISCGHSAGERFTIQHCRQFQSLAIMVTSDVLSSLVGERVGDMLNLHGAPDFFLRRAGVCRQSLRATKQMACLLSQVPHQRLLLHSAALEFLHWHLAALDRRCDGGKGLNARECRLLDDARALLLHDLSMPPTIARLAREVGMNQCKLKKAFKEYFGTTIYAMFQHERMSHAKRLLRTNNVTETATLLGYSNISHFSAAFANQFACLPSQVRRQG